MTGRRTYSALSLDLWFTSLYFEGELDALWRDDRRRLLTDLLRASDGRSAPPAAIDEAMRRVHATHREEGREPFAVDPGALVLEYARALDARLTVSPEEAGRAYSAVGVGEHPPLVNPELPGLLETLERRGVPVVWVTNTARREETWQEFLRRREIRGVRHIVTSCEVGSSKPRPEIFREAARRLDLPPGEILHVGDRGELDVDGALAAGFGTALYRGLWSKYPKGLYPETGPVADPSVPAIDRLDELLEGEWLAPARPDARSPTR